MSGRSGYMIARIPAGFAIAVLPLLVAGAAHARQVCLTDAELDSAVGEAVRSGAMIIRTEGLPDLPMCSGLTVAQSIQRLSAAAFPEEQARIEAERQAVIARENQAARERAEAAAAAMARLAPPAEPEPMQAFVTSEVPQRRATANQTRRTTRKAAATPRGSGGSSYYSSCRAARAAGVTPIRRGSPGYSRHLDRDGDGIACE